MINATYDKSTIRRLRKWNAVLIGALAAASLAALTGCGDDKKIAIQEIQICADELYQCDLSCVLFCEFCEYRYDQCVHE